jgi:hypothetical protein
MMTKERGGKADPGADTQPIPVVPSYQEGSVESVGGGPAGKDESDRDKSSVPGKDPRTRS